MIFKIFNLFTDLKNLQTKLNEFKVILIEKLNVTQVYNSHNTVNQEITALLSKHCILDTCTHFILYSDAYQPSSRSS